MKVLVKLFSIEIVSVRKQVHEPSDPYGGFQDDSDCGGVAPMHRIEGSECREMADN